MIHESNNQLIKHLVNKLRDKQMQSFEFRTTIEEISRILLTEALENHPLIEKNIPTWQGNLTIDAIDEDSIVFIPILRAGQPMLTGLLKTLPQAKSGFLAMKRDEQTAESALLYESFPSLKDKTVILLDPMVATGGSLVSAIDTIKAKQPKQVISLNILGTHEGTNTVSDAHPDIKLFIAQIDPQLDKNNYIRPGLGDAGDRAYATD